LKTVLQRVLYTLPVIWLVVSIVFLMIHLVPGDPIQQMLGEGAPPADIAATRHLYGLDAPLGEQYIHYWKGVLHGDLGRSIRYNQTVSKLIAQRYPYTLRLTLASLFVAIILSIPPDAATAGTTAFFQ
jgi:ABC-type dipeptide/oligopeptide/nickel transport system permease component